MRSRIFRNRLPLSLLLLWLALPGLAAVAASGSEAERAIRLYDQKRYPEARALLEQLDARGEANGPLLYRLYYSRLVANDVGARATLVRARDALETEVESGGDLETFFYLSNAYANLGQSSEMLRAARTATARFESGQFAAPVTSEEMFRIGKLYADINAGDRAAEWYRKSLDTLENEPGSGTAPYVDWAVRYLAKWAFEAEQYDLAERYLSRQLANGPATAADHAQLAQIRARLGLYEEAARAWKRSEELDPANGDQARYAFRIARHAARLEILPYEAPDGRPWNELEKAELEQVLKDVAAEVNEVQTRTAAANAVIREVMDRKQALLDQPEPTERKARKAREKALAELEKEIHAGWEARYVDFEDTVSRLGAAEPLFVAAALEYVSRGYGIREAAFFGGYAPLIFRPKAWKVAYP